MSFPRQYQIPTEFEIASDETIYTVAEYISLLNVKIKPLRAAIQGEIGRIKYSQKALCFSLYDKDRSVINCLVWLSRLNNLGIELKEGLSAKIQGYPDIYPQTGLMTFKADMITPLGEGALKLAFEKLKRDLEVQGYFQQDRKQALPQHIECIGLITSENGVVIRDFLTGLGAHGLKVYFYDVRVEGLHAIEDIVRAIQWFNENTNDVQVLVIARGGGSLERLQPFNTFEIAKVIFGSKIPVMTAIGHELDVTIADMVADVRTSVPMDAGQRLADPWLKAAQRIDVIEENITTRFKNTCRELEQKLSHYTDNFLSCYAKHLSQCGKQINAYQNNLTRCFRDVLRKIKSIEENFNYNYERFASRLTQSKRALDSQENNLFTEANRFIAKVTTHLAVLEEQFANNYTRFHRYLRSLNADLDDKELQIAKDAKWWFLAIRKRINECEKVLAACDPQLKLKQGYSIVTDKSGKVIKSSKTVAVHDIIEVQLNEGRLETKIEQKK
jgi:exodeoxyribonuclease VII large subunit